MRVCGRISVAAFVAICCCAPLEAQVTPTPNVTPTAGAPEMKEETINGVKYQVTRQTVQQQMPVTVMQDRQQTVYTPKVTNESIAHQQVYSVPVTQYEVVPVLHGRWNPFVKPYYTYETQLVTRYQEQVVNVQIPVSKSEWVTETKTVQVPVTEYRMGEREVVTRVALTGGESGRTLAAQPAATQTTSTQPVTIQPYNSQPYTPPANSFVSQPAASYSVQATPVPTYAPTQPSYSYGQPAYTMPAASVATRPMSQPAVGGQMLQADPPRQGSGWGNLPNSGAGYR